MADNISINPECKMQQAWARQGMLNDKFYRHVKEGEEEGGHRDRLGQVEREVKMIKEEKLNTTKNAQYRIGIIVGIVCSLPAWIGLALRIFGK